MMEASETLQIPSVGRQKALNSDNIILTTGVEEMRSRMRKGLCQSYKTALMFLGLPSVSTILAGCSLTLELSI